MCEALRYGFVGANSTHMGPRDNGWTLDDDSSCRGMCGRKVGPCSLRAPPGSPRLLPEPFSA